MNRDGEHLGHPRREEEAADAWRAALHEAAHLIAQRQLMGAQRGYSVIFRGGGGRTIVNTRERSDAPFARLISAAAGSEAERLARQHPRPAGPPAFAEASGHPVPRRSDGEAVAAFARDVLGIPGNEHEHSLWWRLAVAHLGRFFVETYENDVVALARDLYAAGRIDWGPTFYTAADESEESG